MDDLTLLCLHVEAVWSLQLPPLTYGDVELSPDVTPPAWALYLGQLAGGAVRIWTPGISSGVRAQLSSQAEAALRLPPDAPAPSGVSREVALSLRAAPTPESAAAAARLARRLGPDDTALLEAFEPGEAAYYLAPQRAPVFGVVVDGRLLSVAHSSRRTPAACELGVETRPAARRRSYGLAVTLRWAQAVAAEGLLPLYSARADNAASLALAAAAGYRPFAHAAYLSPPPTPRDIPASGATPV